MDIKVSGKLDGKIEAISSKSYAQRAIFMAILSPGKSKIFINHISKDIEAAISCAKSLKCEISYKKNILEIIPPSRFPSEAEFNVSESGATLRFLLPILATLGIKSKITRKGSLISRPNDVFINLFPEHGVEIFEIGPDIYLNGKLDNKPYSIAGDISSQYLSGLLISLSYMDNKPEITLTTKLNSKSYVDMTIDMLNKFGINVKNCENRFIISGEYKSSDIKVEGDYSNLLYFLISEVEVLGLNSNSLQADKKALEILEDMGYKNISEKNIKLEKLGIKKSTRVLDASIYPDAIIGLSVASGVVEGYTKVINIGRLRYKESNRIDSTIEMLENLGLKVELKENEFSFYSVEKYRSCTIDSKNDHRIVMASAVASNFTDGEIIIKNAEAVFKSYGRFFEDYKKLGGKVDVI